MNLDHSHYVPILKLKKAEKDALCGLKPEIRTAVIPLFEVVERKVDATTKLMPTMEKHIDTAFGKLAESVSCVSRFFLDARELEPEGRAATERVYQRAAELNRPFTPVAHMKLGDSAAVAVEHSKHGLAIRLSRGEMEGAKCVDVLARFVRQHRLSPAAVDLILDLGQVESMVPAGVAALAGKCLEIVSVPSAWRSLVLSGCDFPKSMGEVATNSHKFVDRSQWVAWLALAGSRRPIRVPTFSDCGIQHSTGVEGVDMALVKAAPSIRYALSEQWLLIKGCGSKLPSEQYSALAASLTSNELGEYFDGHKHCAGCARMRHAAEREPEANSRMEWRRFGTIHHITRTVENIRTECARLDGGGQP